MAEARVRSFGETGPCGVAQSRMAEEREQEERVPERAVFDRSYGAGSGEGLAKGRCSHMQTDVQPREVESEFNSLV